MPDPQMDFIPPPEGPGSNASALSDDKLESLLLAHARPGACPSPDLLFAAEEDVLPAPHGAAIREHAAHCALCQTLLSELPPADPALSPAADARIRARVQTQLDGRSSARNTGSIRKPTFWLSIAAVAAVLIVGIVSVLTYSHAHSTTSQITVASNHPPAVPSLANLPELHQLAPLAPPDDVPDLVMRGATAPNGPSVQDLMPAFRAYNRGNFAHAAAAFAPLARRFPHSDIPPLYLGVSQLHLGQNADAQHSLAQAYVMTGSPHHDEAAWYLAVADLRLNQPQSALPLLRELCTQNQNTYAPRACTLAQQLAPS